MCLECWTGFFLNLWSFFLRFFRYAFDLLITINAFFIGFDVDEADWFFLVIFTIEIVLKLYVYGPRQFAMRYWNMWVFIGMVILFRFVLCDTGMYEYLFLSSFYLDLSSMILEHVSTGIVILFQSLLCDTGTYDCLFVLFSYSNYLP